eukprot:CAMPEP_0185485782 /NCGR_PEP_ID=MMETSP1366-20130426/10333_1 /TAXON_ID=38817 /ORGANISM="Gephyrocapsa oceanica, Strain RCC1303" /LENGTH=42 /DNA_ID= /DNA_START= /DNA_END= /DNA_ORIENTATION=
MNKGTPRRVAIASTDCVASPYASPTLRPLARAAKKARASVRD